MERLHKAKQLDKMCSKGLWGVSSRLPLSQAPVECACACPHRKYCPQLCEASSVCRVLPCLPASFCLLSQAATGHNAPEACLPTQGTSSPCHSRPYHPSYPSLPSLPALLIAGGGTIRRGGAAAAAHPGAGHAAGRGAVACPGAHAPLRAAGGRGGGHAGRWRLLLPQSRTPWHEPQSSTPGKPPKASALKLRCAQDEFQISPERLAEEQARRREQ